MTGFQGKASTRFTYASTCMSISGVVVTTTATLPEAGSNPANAATPVPHTAARAIAATATIEQVRAGLKLHTLCKTLMMAISCWHGYPLQRPCRRRWSFPCCLSGWAACHGYAMRRQAKRRPDVGFRQTLLLVRCCSSQHLNVASGKQTQRPLMKSGLTVGTLFASETDAARNE